MSSLRMPGEPVCSSREPTHRAPDGKPKFESPFVHYNRLTFCFQVSSIQFNKHYREMVTTHTSPHGEVRLWEYTGEGEEKFACTAELKGHLGRVLDSALSPSGQYVLTVGNDESLRLWNCWKRDKSVTGEAASPSVTQKARRKYDGLPRPGLCLR